MAPGQSNSAEGGAERLNFALGGADLPASPASALVMGGGAPGGVSGAARSPQPRSWRWLLMGLSTCCALGSVAAAALLWMFILPPAPNCQSISRLATDMGRLYCAQEAARSGDLPELLAGLEMVETWPSDHPLYHEAKRWMEDWSESVLAIAHQKIAASDLQGALATARQIPRTSPVFADAQTAIAQWQAWWKAGEAVSAEVQAALKAQNWDLASAKIQSMSDMADRHWNTEQPSNLTQQLVIERRARQTLNRAITTAQPGKLRNLSAAIAAVGQIDRQTYAWTDAQTALNRWSDTLLTVGLTQWKAQNLDHAIALARQVLVNPSREAEALNLIRLSAARKLAISTVTNWQPSPQHGVNLMEAVAAARQIPPGSRFYAQAQDSLASWQAQLEGVRTLQMAQVTANLGQSDALELAIAQAQTIAPSHPRRVQAQTLIAHWHREQDRLADSPMLVRARQLAAPGTVAAMRLAIAQANRVPMGRALRGEAQGLIYSWTRQIETIEDQPYLSMARTLARRDRLPDAIRSAALVRPGRALYTQAQAAIRSWRSELHRSARRAIALSTPRTATPATRRAEPPPPQNPTSASPQLTRSSTRPAPAALRPTANSANSAAQSQPATGEQSPSPSAPHPPETRPSRVPSSAAELGSSLLSTPAPAVEPPAGRVPSAASESAPSITPLHSAPSEPASSEP